MDILDRLPAIREKPKSLELVLARDGKRVGELTRKANTY